jgi:malic enzyme
MFPIIYTPTEAEAIADYSHLFRRSEGLYLTPPAEDGMEADFLDACAGRELDLVCGTCELHYIALTECLIDRVLGCRGYTGDWGSRIGWYWD